MSRNNLTQGLFGGVKQASVPNPFNQPSIESNHPLTLNNNRNSLSGPGLTGQAGGQSPGNFGGFFGGEKNSLGNTIKPADYLLSQTSTPNNSSRNNIPLSNNSLQQPEQKVQT